MSHDIEEEIGNNLQKLCTRHRLMGAVVLNLEGLVLGSYISSTAQDKFGHRVDEIIATMGAVFDDITLRAQEDLKMENIDEVTVNSKDFKLVFRLFSIGERALMLGLIMGPYASYRRPAAYVIKQISSAMKL